MEDETYPVNDDEYLYLMGDGYFDVVEDVRVATSVAVARGDLLKRQGA